MASKFKKVLSYIIPPLITVGLCYVLYSDVNFYEIFAQLGQWNYGLMALFLSCNVMAMLFRAVRWRLQLRAIDISPSLGVMTCSIFGCYALNMLLPRLGEFWRSAYIAKGAKKPFSGVFGSMMADRLSDTLSVGIIAIIAFFVASGAMISFVENTSLFDSVASMLSSWTVIILVALLIAAILLVIYSKNPFLSRVRSFVVKTWAGFAVVFKMPKRGLWLLLTLGIWVSYVSSMYISMLAFAPTAELIGEHGFACALLAFVFSAFSMGIPSNGGIGPWQIAVLMCLSGIYGLSRDLALGFATVNLAASTLLTICLGIGSFAVISLKKR